MNAQKGCLTLSCVFMLYYLSNNLGQCGVFQPCPNGKQCEKGQCVPKTNAGK